MCWGVLESSHLIISTNQKKRDPKRKRFFSSYFVRFFGFLLFLFKRPYASVIVCKAHVDMKQPRARV
jgi:hypothetical protein